MNDVHEVIGGIGRWITRRVFHSGDDIAIVEGDRRISYAELDRRTDQLAAALRDRGDRQGDRVACLQCNGSRILPSGCRLLADQPLGHPCGRANGTDRPPRGAVGASVCRMSPGHDHKPNRELPPGMAEQLDLLHAGVASFGHRPFLTEPEQLDSWQPDVAIVGAPFDIGTTNRPGARFGPRAIRATAYEPGTYHMDLGLEIFDWLEVVDFGDASGAR